MSAVTMRAFGTALALVLVSWRPMAARCVEGPRVLQQLKIDWRASQRAWLKRRLPRRTSFIDDEWRDARGSCAIRFAHGDQAPQLRVCLTGVGSREVARSAIDTLSDAFDAFQTQSPRNRSVSTLVDMTDAVACSQSGIRRCLRFVKDHGGALDKVAVVGRGFSLHYVRLLVRVARFRNIRVFGDPVEAHEWLHDA